LLAARTTLQQSPAQEITANLRPNPALFGDWDLNDLRYQKGDISRAISEYAYQRGAVRRQ
jgi:hypothetical protein